MIAKLLYNVVHTNGTRNIIPNEDGHMVHQCKGMCECRMICPCLPKREETTEGVKILHNVLNN